MKIIVGLGNPGEKFRHTRHNFGFMAIDVFAEKNNFPDFKMSKKFDALVSEEIIGEEKVLLAKPQTFMNNSGRAVKKLTPHLLSITFRPVKRRFILKRWGGLVVIHDDIDLPLGTIKIVKNRGSAGHKGVESIIKEIGTKNFIRLRLGIKPKQYHGLVNGTEKFVLQKFVKEEEKIVKQVIEKSVDAIESLIKDGLEKTMNEFNK